MRRKNPCVRPWCEFASSFRLRLEKGKPANQLPKWDVQRPEVAKSTEDDLVLVDHQPGPNEESANIGADGIVFLGAMLEEAEAEANKNHWEGGVPAPGPDGESDVRASCPEEAKLASDRLEQSIKNKNEDARRAKREARRQKWPRTPVGAADLPRVNTQNTGQPI